MIKYHSINKSEQNRKEREHDAENFNKQTFFKFYDLKILIFPPKILISLLTKIQ